MGGVGEYHNAKLTSQGVQHGIFADGHQSMSQPYPIGLKFGQQRTRTKKRTPYACQATHPIEMIVDVGGVILDHYAR